jgi:hypothetical protein
MPSMNPDLVRQAEQEWAAASRDYEQATERLQRAAAAVRALTGDPRRRRPLSAERLAGVLREYESKGIDGVVTSEGVSVRQAWRLVGAARDRRA